MKERLALWDNLKFILIMLVVVGHFSDLYIGSSDAFKSLSLFIYAFHMPLFLFVSGLFHKDKNITKKCLFYVSAGFLTKMVITLFTAIVGKGAKFSLLSDGGIPWFMFSLAAYTLLMYLLRNQNKKYLLAFGILLALFAGFDKNIGDYLYISRIVVFFPCYLLGSMIGSEKIISFKEKYKWSSAIALLVLLLWAYLAFFHLDTMQTFRHLFSGRNPYSEAVVSYGPLARLFCYALTFITGFSLILLTPSKQIPCISKMGSRSIDVYFWHWPCLLLLERFLHISKLVAMGPAGKVGFILIAVALTFLLSAGTVFSFPLKQVKNAIYKK